MRPFVVFGIVYIPSAWCLDYAPFLPPFPNAQPAVELRILGRANSKCGTSCSDMGSGMCCGNKATCALDGAGNVACCPNNAVCTGTISAGNDVTSGAATAVGPATTAAPSAAISHAIGGSSTVPNSYYPFPILPTTYANAGECSASFSGCQAELAKCTGFVEGGGYAVTVSGAQGGITQQGAMAPASAEAICSSLSQQACHGLNLVMCSTLGGAVAAKATSAGPSGSFIVGSASSGAAAPTNCAGMYGVGIGMAIGVVGQVIR